MVDLSKPPKHISYDCPYNRFVLESSYNNDLTGVKNDVRDVRLSKLAI